MIRVTSLQLERLFRVDTSRLIGSYPQMLHRRHPVEKRREKRNRTQRSGILRSVAQASLSNVAAFLAPRPGNLAWDYQSKEQTRDPARLAARPQTLQGLSLKDDAKRVFLFNRKCSQNCFQLQLKRDHAASRLFSKEEKSSFVVHEVLSKCWASFSE